MLNSKQRAKLRSLASKLDATAIIGKDGLSDMVVAQIDRELDKKEMVKISVLDSADFSAKEYLKEVSSKLKADEVCSIGRKFVVYRYSTRQGIKHIEF